jgi:hypothetical protein
MVIHDDLISLFSRHPGWQLQVGVKPNPAEVALKIQTRILHHEIEPRRLAGARALQWLSYLTKQACQGV